MKKSLKILTLGLFLSTNIYGVTISECYKYEEKLNHYITALNNQTKAKKKYPMLMVKSYYDSIMTECDGIIDISHWKKQTSTLKGLWKNYVPKYVREMPENKWKY